MEEFSGVCDKPLTFHFTGTLIGSSITMIMIQIEIVQYFNIYLVEKENYRFILVSQMF